MNSRSRNMTAAESAAAQYAKTGRIEEACQRYGIGKTTMRALASEAGAVVRVGKIWLVNYSVLDKWMDDHADTV